MERLLDGTHINGYEVVTHIGHGTFSHVYKVRDSKNNMYAMKFCHSGIDFHVSTETEWKVMNRLQKVDKTTLRENFIIHVVEIFMHDGHRVYITELCTKTLFMYIYGRDVRDTETILRFARELATALHFLCSVLGVSHGDLKPQNVVLQTDFSGRQSVRLIDFGAACVGKPRGRFRPDQYKATRFYRSPESLLGCDTGPLSDVWALGCVVAEMMTHTFLFAAKTSAQLMREHILLLGMPSKTMLRKAKQRVQKLDPTSVMIVRCFKERHGQYVYEYPIQDPVKRASVTQDKRHSSLSWEMYGYYWNGPQETWEKLLSIVSSTITFPQYRPTARRLMKLLN